MLAQRRASQYIKGSPLCSEAPARPSVDHRAFRYVYFSEGPAFSATMREVNALSRPIFIAAVPASGLAALAAGADLDPTARLAATQLGVGAAVFGLKFLVRRPRPYVALPDVKSRVAVPLREHDPYSLPSGHAAVSFAMATSVRIFARNHPSHTLSPRPPMPTRFMPSFQSQLPIKGRPCGPEVRPRSMARMQCS